MKRILLLVLVAIPFITFAQRDTIYYKGIIPVATMEECDNYRLPFVPDGEKYKVLEYYKSGALKTQGFSRSFDSLIWEGPYMRFYENGNKEETGNYINGYKAANWKAYSEDGKLWVLTSYNPLSDTFEILRSFYKTGKVKRIEYTIKDKEPTGTCFDENGNEMKFTPFGVMPEFEGDINAFLAKTIRYPSAAVISDLEGKVLVRFVVIENGTVEDVRVVDPSIDPVLMLEAIRAVKLTNGKWKPGKEDDIPVKVYFTLPVLFRLE